MSSLSISASAFHSFAQLLDCDGDDRDSINEMLFELEESEAKRGLAIGDTVHTEYGDATVLALDCDGGGKVEYTTGLRLYLEPEEIYHGR